jgi:DNA polymerase delta subunit 1
MLYSLHISVDTPPPAAAAAAAAAAVTGALEDGVSVGGRFYSLGSYESNVLYTLRFMVDTDMGGGQWIEVPAGEALIPHTGFFNPCLNIKPNSLDGCMH